MRRGFLFAWVVTASLGCAGSEQASSPPADAGEVGDTSVPDAGPLDSAIDASADSSDATPRDSALGGDNALGGDGDAGTGRETGEGVDAGDAGDAGDATDGEGGSSEICNVGDTRPCVPYPYQPAIPDETTCLDGSPCVAPCKNGTQTCIAPEGGIIHWGSCVGAIGPNPSDTCDLHDDGNCNGVPNEQCACINGQSGSCGTILHALGPCAAGTTVCTFGGWGLCSIRPAVSDQCSVPGDDSNCNGLVHDTCPCTPGQTGTCGAILEARGSCAAGVAMCNAVGSAWTCSVEPSADTCDPGNDNSCNGIPNEGCACINGSTCADGSLCVQGACSPIVVTALAFTSNDTVPLGGIVATAVDSSASDSASSLTATINWGDATAPAAGVITGGAGSFTVTGAHTYMGAGTATVTVTVTSSVTHATASGTATVTIRPWDSTHTRGFPVSGVPTWIAVGPDGALWFTEEMNDRVDRVTTGFVFTSYPVPSGSRPLGIAAGGDGNVWIAENASGKIARMTTAGVVTEFAVPVSGSHPEAIALGPDGNLWFVDQGTSSVGYVTPSGQITELAIPTPASAPAGITAGPDGNLWFTEKDKIGRVTPAGAFTEFGIPTPGSGPAGIAAGPDGNLWFTEQAANGIGRVTPVGAIREFSVPTAGAKPAQITAGPNDGSVWFSEVNAGNVARVSPTGLFSEFPAQRPAPLGIVSGPDGGVWFTTPTGIVRIAP
jgi:streptogramin lyase